jgi:hypothetical protein
MFWVILYFMGYFFFIACCLRWRGEGLLMCFRVGFSFLYGSVGGWAESLFCYFLMLFTTLFGCCSIRRGFKNRKSIGKVDYYELRMVERSYWWIERWIIFPLFLFFSLSFFFFLSLSLSFSLFLSLSLSFSFFSFFLSLFLSFSIFLSFCLSFSLSFYLRTAKRKELA